MRNRRLLVLSFALLLVMAGSLPAIMIHMSATDLTARADMIVSGTVTKLSSRWDDAHALIYTDVTIAPSGFEKGATDRPIIVRVPGGEVDDIGLAVEDMPIFTTGEQVRLYLTRATDAAAFELVGGYQAVTAPGGKQYYYSYSGYHRSPATCNYYINSSLPSDWVSAIQAGDATWDAAGSAFRYNYLGTTTKTGPTADNTNVIWRDNLAQAVQSRRTTTGTAAGPRSFPRTTSSSIPVWRGQPPAARPHSTCRISALTKWGTAWYWTICTSRIRAK